jgi:hypothetical protein
MIANVRASSVRDRRKCRHLRVTLNGADVSSRCFYADTARGVVRLFDVHADGSKVIAGDGADRHISWREHHGAVRIERQHRDRPTIDQLERQALRAIEFLGSRRQRFDGRLGVILHPRWQSGVADALARGRRFDGLPVSFSSAVPRTCARLHVRHA